MNKISLFKMVRIWKQFLGKDWDEYTKEQKCKHIENYRIVEERNIKMIEKYGSVESWYLSGEGRVINF